MLSFEPEIERLRPEIGDDVAEVLIARERRLVLSIHPELRMLSWAGAMLLAAAAGVLLKNNLERIGPVALAISIGIAAIACYAFVWWRRARAGLVDDYILLLGALLVSADVAFAESQFHLLGADWPRHLLLLTVVHAAGAYAYRSRVLLSLSLGALASWCGVSKLDVFNGKAVPCYAAAALLLVWREAHRRGGGERSFLRVFEHFTALLAIAGAFALMSPYETFHAGCVMLVLTGAAAMAWGFRARAEAFALYGVIAVVIGVDAWILMPIRFGPETWLVILLSVATSVTAVIALHRRFARGAE